MKIAAASTLLLAGIAMGFVAGALWKSDRGSEKTASVSMPRGGGVLTALDSPPGDGRGANAAAGLSKSLYSLWAKSDPADAVRHALASDNKQRRMQQFRFVFEHVLASLKWKIDLLGSGKFPARVKECA
jgi:hypothetical protein